MYDVPRATDLPPEEEAWDRMIDALRRVAAWRERNPTATLFPTLDVISALAFAERYPLRPR